MNSKIAVHPNGFQILSRSKYLYNCRTAAHSSTNPVSCYRIARRHTEIGENGRLSVANKIFKCTMVKLNKKRLFRNVPARGFARW